MKIDDTSEASGGPAGRLAGLGRRQPPWRLDERARRLWLAGADSRVLNGGATAADASGGGTRRADLHDVMAVAIREDTAASLGRAGRRLQAAVEALCEADVRSAALSVRERFADEAADALWSCVVQREALGLVDHRMLNETYRIPVALWRRMGAPVRR